MILVGAGDVIKSDLFSLYQLLLPACGTVVMILAAVPAPAHVSTMETAAMTTTVRRCSFMQSDCVDVTVC